MSLQEFTKRYLDEHRAYFEEVSEYIFRHPETRFEEYESAKYLADQCEAKGFTVERGVGGIGTAFTATFGEGHPVIGFLGEFDALPELSQEPNSITEQRWERHIGHGCGHNLLGTGAFAAACAAKAYLEETGQTGTVKFFGCPGEEGGSGKTFMAREGVFDGTDLALTWHPSPTNSIMSLSTLANIQVFYRFKGVPSHAANSPHLGRSALDAVELMNTGVQYLREHMPDQARIHYAITNTGGFAPNVVQANAEVLYLIRDVDTERVMSLFERVNKVAEGAALMTETDVTVEIDKACSNYIPNRALERILYDSLSEIGIEPPTEEEKEFARGIFESLSEAERKDYLGVMKGFGYVGDGSEFEGKYVSDCISPYEVLPDILTASTDVSDVSWIMPTAQLSTSTSALGTPLHTWQMTSQGLSANAHKGMLRAGGAMALTALKIFGNTDLLAPIRDEYTAFAQKNPYNCPIPADVSPSPLGK
ncbi:amidohydrolase [Sporosarcina trichiuri]|nr:MULTISPECIES: amidohydrolase [Sporosarcina]WJY26264.1 amidohydrolase [Sporosarcina sp. 0.2-SM1T-5]